MPQVAPQITSRQFTATTHAAPPPLNVTSINNPHNPAPVPAQRPGAGGTIALQPAQPIVEVDPSDRTTWPANTGIAFSPTPAQSAGS